MTRPEGKSLEDFKAYFERYAMEYTIEGEAKFNYFMIGLTFAILGLSVERTAADQISCVTQLAWIVLLVSGLSGILLMRSNPDYVGMFVNRIKYDKVFDLLKEGALEKFGEGPDLVKTWADLTRSRKSLKEFLDTDPQYRNLRRAQNWRYEIQIWAFVIGIMALAIDKLFMSAA